MARLRWLLSRLGVLFRRRRHEADLDAEIRFHLEAEAEEQTADGLSPDAARLAARRSLGNVARTQEDTREVWTWRWLEDLAQDARYAVRVLRRRPVFTVTALLSLALGIGASVAVFSLIDNLLLKPLPVDRPHELVRLARPDEVSGSETYTTYERFRDQVGGLDGVAGMTGLTPRPSEVEIDAQRAYAHVQMVTDNYFEVLGVRPYRGQVIREPALGTARAAIAVISHEYWQRQFAGSPDVIGSRFITWGRMTFTVAGVTPPAFRGADLDFPVDIWVPFEVVVAPGDDDRTRGRWIQVVARRHADVPLDVLSTQASSVLGRPMEVRDAATGFSRLRGRLAQPVLLLGLLTGLVLLVTCANISNLALSGTTARDRELAVRQAIGASRGRVARQLATEGIVLTLAGAALALMVAPWMNETLLNFLPPAQVRAIENLSLVFDLRVAVLMAALSLVTCLLVGCVPALRATRRHATSAIKTSAGSGQRTRSWTSRGLVVLEVAMCTILLVTAGVFARTTLNLRNQDTGYREDQLLVADIEPPRTYAENRRDQLIDTLVAHARTAPGVEVAAFSHHGQLSGGGLEYPISVPGAEPPSGDATVFQQRVSQGFFAAMGTRIVAGRDFAPQDDGQAADVAIVNETFARRYFGGLDAVGKQFVQEWPQARPMRVVGVVADSKWINLRDERPAMYYVPYRQQPGSPVVRMVVRTSGSLHALSAQLAQAARAVDPGMQISNIVPFTEIVNRTLVVERLIAHVTTAFAALGLAIACIGLYGILAFAVVRRTREIGVRIALGARPRSVEWMFLRESMVLIALGFAVGLPVAYLVTRSVSALLFGITPGDPATTAITLFALSMTGLAASWIPARRAARIDPMQALRQD